MASKEWAQRIVSALHALGKRTHGGLSRAERDANVAASYIRRRKYAGTIDLVKMMVRIPTEVGHRFRFKSATHSDASRPSIPIRSRPLFET